ncbi:MAG: DnaA N-terminal domain-containing protein [Alphaproteobacteria bacterium]
MCGQGGSVLRSTEKLSDSTPPQGPAAWAEAWARIRAKLREEVGDVEFRSWLRQMTR